VGTQYLPRDGVFIQVGGEAQLFKCHHKCHHKCHLSKPSTRCKTGGAPSPALGYADLTPTCSFVWMCAMEYQASHCLAPGHHHNILCGVKDGTA